MPFHQTLTYTKHERQYPCPIIPNCTPCWNATRLGSKFINHLCSNMLYLNQGTFANLQPSLSKHQASGGTLYFCLQIGGRFLQTSMLKGEEEVDAYTEGDKYSDSGNIARLCHFFNPWKLGKSVFYPLPTVNSFSFLIIANNIVGQASLEAKYEGRQFHSPKGLYINFALFV